MAVIARCWSNLGIRAGALDQISGIHDARLIAKGLPGAGNILLFDNEGEAGFPPVPLKVTGGSRVLEIDPTNRSDHLVVYGVEIWLAGLDIL